MQQNKRQIGVERDYPGSFAWPVFEVYCPECHKFSGDYGDIDMTDDDGDIHMLCGPCGNTLFPAEIK